MNVPRILNLSNETVFIYLMGFSDMY